MTSDRSTAPTPSQEARFQGNLFTPASSVLELRYVSCAYETGRPAVQGISFAAREGEILCLLGPSGCGKTMLARENFDGPHVWHTRRTLPQDAQKVRPARPQRAKRRGVRFGTLSL